MITEKKNQLVYTEILCQFEINAKMDISKNQWKSTGGLTADIFSKEKSCKYVLLQQGQYLGMN